MPLSSPDTDVARSIKRRLNVLLGATIVLWVVVIVLAGLAYSNSQRNQDALCTLRSDLQNRVKQTEDFIAHPEKFPGIKIDPQSLQPQLEGQRRTIAALGGLGCS